MLVAIIMFIVSACGVVTAVQQFIQRGRVVGLWG